LLDMLAFALGGRAAEELVFHEPTTGAANDIEKATATARAMVTAYGMSARLGALKFGQESGEVFLGRDMGHQRDYSEEVAAEIDEEVRGLVEAAHDEAFEILSQYREVLDDMVLRLLDKETLSKDEVLEIFAPINKRPARDISVPNPKRQPSDQPPVLTPAELALLGPDDVADLVRGNRGEDVDSASGAAARAGSGGASPRSRRAPSRSGSVNRDAETPEDRAADKGGNGGAGNSRSVRRSKPSTEPGS